MEWIPVKERLPKSTEEIVLVYIDNKIYMGSFSISESYNIDNDVIIKNYAKRISFSPIINLDITCDECKTSDSLCRDGHCINCCEKDMEISLLIPCFGLDKITHWMPLPDQPERLNEKTLKDDAIVRTLEET